MATLIKYLILEYLQFYAIISQITNCSCSDEECRTIQFDSSFKSFKNWLFLYLYCVYQLNQLEKEVQIIIQHWIRILKIKLGWINDFDKLVVNYVMFPFVFLFSFNRKLRVWDIENSKQIQSFSGHSDSVYCVKFSPYHYHKHCQNVICSSSLDRTIRFWDFKHNKQLQIFSKHSGGVGGIEFSPFNGGRYLCSTSGDNNIRLWDVETYRSLHIFNGHEHGVWCIDISPLQGNNNNGNKSNNIGVIGGNGYTICSGSFDKTIRIWDIETTKQLILFIGHQNV
ncbi:hypothetical protein RFI_32941, partial [Reticulomyxa filosa]